MWKLVIAVTLAAACGCASESTAPTTSTTGAEVGTYTLVSLDGRTLPTSIPEGRIEVEVISATLTLGAGRSARISTTFRLAPAAPVTNELNGTYSMQGNTLSLSFSNGGRGTATLDGGTLRMLNEGVTWVFQRA